MGWLGDWIYDNVNPDGREYKKMEEKYRRIQERNERDLDRRMEKMRRDEARRLMEENEREKARQRERDIKRSSLSNELFSARGRLKEYILSELIEYLPDYDEDRVNMAKKSEIKEAGEKYIDSLISNEIQESCKDIDEELEMVQSILKCFAEAI